MFKKIIQEASSAIAATIVTLAICSLAYTLVVWGAASAAMRRRAEGSLVTDSQGRVVGSELIGQSFTSDRFFHPRPSAVSYDASAAAGSNLGSKNPELRKQYVSRSQALIHSGMSEAPADLVAASGSGLDPHIALDSALAQCNRVAKVRGVSPESLERLVNRMADRSGAVLGAPARVNVLLLNLALDRSE